MDELLQQFDAPVRDRDGELYTVFLYGRSRPGDTWEGWLVFERGRDRQRFTTPVETTQPNRNAVVYWATGLTSAYFEGALDRAKHPIVAAPANAASAPLVGYGVDHETRDE
ncbi:MAG: hypothetical protein ACLGH0_04340, partial [Thermoanaerobaculia bacterium]